MRITRGDLLFFAALLVFALLVHKGRMGASIEGVDLTTDSANYAAMAAAQAHPQAFARDPAFADPAVYGAHSTVVVPLTRWLAQEENFGLAYLRLTGVHVFLLYLSFYALGVTLFKKRWQAALFSLLMGQIYWIPWGTYWGGGHADHTPRVSFIMLYPLYILGALAALRRPAWRPPFMAATGLLVYVHSISALPVALGFWLGLALRRPEGWSTGRHAAWMLLSGLCFLAVAFPFVRGFLTPGPSLTADDVRMLREVLLARFNPEFTHYWQGLAAFFWQFTLLPLFPLALGGAWVITRRGTAEDKVLLGQFGMWTLGVLLVACLFLIDQETALRLGRHHYEFDLIRGLRFLVFFSICVAFLGCNVLWRSLPPHHVWGRRLAATVWLGLFAGLFLGGQQDLARKSLAWYWNSQDPQRMEAAYGYHLRRAEMIDALKTHTEPGALIFYPEEDQAIRHNALRPLAYSWKDVGSFYYAKSVDNLRRWLDLHSRIDASPTAYVDVAPEIGADYVLSIRPQDRSLLERLGPIVWENDIYLLVRLEAPRRKF